MHGKQGSSGEGLPRGRGLLQRIAALRGSARLRRWGAVPELAAAALSLLIASAAARTALGAQESVPALVPGGRAVRVLMLLLLATVLLWRTWTLLGLRGSGATGSARSEALAVGWFRIAGGLFAGTFIDTRFVEGGAPPGTSPGWLLIAWGLVTGIGAAVLSLAAIVFALRAERMADGDLAPLEGGAPLQRAGIACAGAAVILVLIATLPAVFAGTPLREAPGTGAILPFLAAGVALALTVSAAAAIFRAGLALRPARAACETSCAPQGPAAGTGRRRRVPGRGRP